MYSLPVVVTLGLLLAAPVLAPERRSGLPERRSGLPVARYEHLTPRGSAQMFQYSRLLRVF